MKINIHLPLQEPGLHRDPPERPDEPEQASGEPEQVQGQVPDGSAGDRRGIQGSGHPACGCRRQLRHPHT